MTSRDFAYWLQGFFELSESEELSKKQVEVIKNHLNMVFYHDIDKSFGDDLKGLQDVHSGITRTVDYRGVQQDSSGKPDLGSIRINC